MSNEQIQTLEPTLRPGEVAQVDVSAYQDNVVSLPIRPESTQYEMSDQGVLADPSDGVVIDDRIVAAREHADFLDATQRVKDSIVETRQANAYEPVRQALFTGDPRDRNAEDNSAKAFNAVDSLQRPAGIPTASAIGSTALNIK